MERTVVVGGLMISGSFLLAALLNRSAMDEVTASSPAAPVAAVAPMSPPRSEAALTPNSADCSGADGGVEPELFVAKAEQPAAKDCARSD